MALAPEGVPLIAIQRKLGHSNLGIASVYVARAVCLICVAERRNESTATMSAANPTSWAAASAGGMKHRVIRSPGGKFQRQAARTTAVRDERQAS